MWVCARICMCEMVGVYVRMHVSVCVYAYVSVRECWCMCVWVCEYVCMRVYTGNKQVMNNTMGMLVWRDYTTNIIMSLYKYYSMIKINFNIIIHIRGSSLVRLLEIGDYWSYLDIYIKIQIYISTVDWQHTWVARAEIIKVKYI